jgi:hypothetical protein
LAWFCQTIVASFSLSGDSMVSFEKSIPVVIAHHDAEGILPFVVVDAALAQKNIPPIVSS